MILGFSKKLLHVKGLFQDLKASQIEYLNMNVFKERPLLFS